MTATPPAPDRTARLDAEAVATAALAIAARGELISTTAVLRELGRGSMSTVAKHLKAWAATAMPVMAGKATAPKWTARELEGMALLRKVFREEAAAALAEERAEAAEDVRVAREAAATAQEQAKQADAARSRAEERAGGLETGMAALQEQLTAANRASDEKDVQIARLQEATAESSRQHAQTVADMRQQVADAETRFKGMEVHMHRMIDEARTSHADAKKRLEEDLAMANARFQRANTDLDRVRGEREAFEGRATKAEAELAEALTSRAHAERRLSVAEGQVATLIEKTDRLATAQAGLSEQLVAAQRTAETADKAHQRLQRATTALVAATPEPGETLAKAGQAKLAKALAAVTALLPPA